MAMTPTEMDRRIEEFDAHEYLVVGECSGATEYLREAVAVAGHQLAQP